MMAWSNNWISNDVSIWSILMKLKVSNEISNALLKKYYTNSLDKRFLFEEIFPYTVNYSTLSKHLDFNLIEYLSLQFEKWGLDNLGITDFQNIIAKNFRYCPQCIQFGYHSTLHQLHIFRFCPYHRHQLLTNICI